MLTSFRDLDFYRDSYQLALDIHELTLTFPVFERNELGGQMRRSSKGIPQNIAEGWGRRELEKEFKRFLLIAIGSCDEMQCHLDFCRDLKYITVDAHDDLVTRYQSVAKRATAFRLRWERH